MFTRSGSSVIASVDAVAATGDKDDDDDDDVGTVLLRVGFVHHGIAVEDFDKDNRSPINE